MNLVRPIVCVVTRARGAAESPERAALIARLVAAAASGASMIQIRERQLSDRSLVEFAGGLIRATRGTGCLVTINDRTDLALAAGAAGVHLKDGSVPAADVRSIVPADFLVGRSVHGAREAQAAEREGCDYLVFGTVFPSVSKSAGHPVAGLEGLRAACSAVSLPVVAIGGINLVRAAEAAAAGAAGAAAISYFADARDIAVAVRALRAALTRPSGHV